MKVERLQIVSYDSRWVLEFEEERDRIAHSDVAHEYATLKKHLASLVNAEDSSRERTRTPKANSSSVSFKRLWRGVSTCVMSSPAAANATDVGKRCTFLDVPC